MIQLMYAIPRPCRDVIQNFCSNPPEGDKNIKYTALHVAVAAFQFFAYRNGFLTLPQAALAGIPFSMPGAALAAGSTLFYLSAQKAFSELAMSFGCLAAGYFVLEMHDYCPWGILDWSLNHYQNNQGPGAIGQTEKTGGGKNAAEVSYPEEGPTDAKRGIFKHDEVLNCLGKDRVEFFYTFEDAKNGGNAQTEAHSQTGGGKKKGDYAVFGNTFKAAFNIDGCSWPSREHYFQAQKFKKDSPTYKDIQEGKKKEFAEPGTLRTAVRHASYNKDRRLQSPADWARWDATEAYQVMHRANLEFFNQHQLARELLLVTGLMPIVERNNHPDIWGITFGNNPDQKFDKSQRINRNRQGWILMQVRAELAGY